MKNTKIYYLRNTFLLILILITSINCEREMSDDATNATFAKTAEIFTDTPVGMGSNFYFPYGGSKPTAWSVDNEVSFKGTSSMRFDVPNADDPAGNYAGAIFRVDGAGRDLSGYDALTFYVKASQGVNISEFGFGEDFFPNKYISTIKNVSVGTNWQKVIIPIPDASKLINEKGMFRYASGTQGTNSLGYIFWIDELKFEKLGTIAQSQPKIMNGIAVIQPSFIGSEITLTDLSQTFNLASGQNQTVIVAPSYFTFVSSDNAIATVNELGIVSIVGIGTATITASLNNIAAVGSLQINASEAFVNATNPSLPQANVISIYSDAYTSLAGLNPGIFAGGGTGTISNQVYANNNHLSYQTVGFVGIGWTGTVNVSSKTMVHLDIQLKSDPGANLRVELIDFGPDNIDNGFGPGNGTAGGFNVSSQLVKDAWVSVNIPLNAFTLPTGGGGGGSPNKNNIGYVVFVSNNGATFLVDNIYFY